MPLKYIKSLNTGSISSGGSATVNFTTDEDMHVSHIFINDRQKTSLQASQVWIELGAGNVITKDYSPASIFGNSILTALPIDVIIPKGASVTVKITNGEGQVINCDICFEVTT